MEVTIGILILFVIVGFFYLKSEIKDLKEENEKTVRLKKTDDGNYKLTTSKGETIILEL